VFLVPAALGMLAASMIFVAALLQVQFPQMPQRFGNYWVVGASALAALSHQTLIMGLAAHVYGVREGYRLGGQKPTAVTRIVSLETMLITGLVFVALGTSILVGTAMSWSARDFGPTYSVLPAVGGTLSLVLGAQSIFGGFLLSVIGGNEARFLANGAAA
jgi:branched-subunit amino acid transport protein